MKKIARVLTIGILSCNVYGSTSVMQDFPPVPETQVTLKNWSISPFSHWGMKNAGIVSSVMVPRAGNIYQLPKNELSLSSIENISFTYNGKTLSVIDAMKADNTDGFLVIKDNNIVYEKYFGSFTEHDHHLWASSTKSLISMAVGILVDQNLIELNKKVSDYLPELSSGAFSDLTVDQVLKMVSAINYSEEYEDLLPGSVHYEYFRRLSFPTPAFDLIQTDPADGVARGIQRFLPQFQSKDGMKPGTVFEYQSPNVDVMGWIIERQSGMPLQTFISRNIWSKLQTEHDAFFTTDADFTPIATGGFNSSLRDFARFGLAVLNDGKINGKRVFPENWIKDTYTVSAEDIANTQRSVYKDKSSRSYDEKLQAYKNFWWIHDRDKGIFTARGVFGQTLYINKEKNVVITFFSSAPSASNAMRESYKAKLEATQVIADSL